MRSRRTPSRTISSAHEIAAAPAPEMQTRTASSRLPTSSSALSSAAPEMIAVPCWSSWKTGMSSAARSVSSISKHSGALMSSRLMPPKVGAIALTVWITTAGSWLSSSMSKTSTSANFLKSTALPSITGLPASAPRSPSPRMAVPFEITATRLPLAVYS